MKKKKIYYIHPRILELNDIKDKMKIFYDDVLLGKDFKDFEFVWDEHNPDYLFVSEIIYYSIQQRKARKIFNKLIKNKPITIFFAGECIEPDFNIYDYAIVFDRKLSYGDRVSRIPTMKRYYPSVYKKSNDINDIDKAIEQLKAKRFFCNFIYSNGNAHEQREKIFQSISKYKFVHSLGRYLNNYQLKDENIVKTQDWRVQSIKIKELFKFSIAAENANYPGYVSEKLLTSFQAHTIPIYWGDPLVAEEFNKKAFIDCNDFDSLSELVKKIEEIDKNDELWLKMIQEPWQTEGQQINEEKEFIEYIKFIENIFKQEKKFAYRRAFGYHPEMYRLSFKDWYPHVTLKQKLKIFILKVKELLKYTKRKR